MTKTLTGYDVLAYVKMSWQRNLKQCHLHSKCHYWAKYTYVSLMHTPSSKVLPLIVKCYLPFLENRFHSN